MYRYTNKLFAYLILLRIKEIIVKKKSPRIYKRTIIKFDNIMNRQSKLKLHLGDNHSLMYIVMETVSTSYDKYI